MSRNLAYKMNTFFTIRLILLHRKRLGFSSFELLIVLVAFKQLYNYLPNQDFGSYIHSERNGRVNQQASTT